MSPYLTLELLSNFLENMWVEPKVSNQRCGCTSCGFMSPKEEFS